MMTSWRGRVGSSMSELLTNARGLSMPGMEGSFGSEPVSMKMRFASMLRVPDAVATVRCVASANDARPSMTSTFSRSASAR